MVFILKNLARGWEGISELLKHAIKQIKLWRCLTIASLITQICPCNVIFCRTQIIMETESHHIGVLGIELECALIAFLLQKNDASTIMFTNEYDYLEKHPVAIQCDSKWVSFLLSHKLQNDISLMISDGLEVDKIIVPMNKQQVFNSGFSLLDKRYIMKYIESFLLDKPLPEDLPPHLQSLIDTLQDPNLSFNKASLEKSAIYQSKSPQLTCQYNLEQELCQLLTRKTAVLGGLQIMNAKLEPVIQLNKKFVYTCQYGNFITDILIVHPSHIHLLSNFNISEMLEETWYFATIPAGEASVVVQNVNNYRVYGIKFNSCLHLMSLNREALQFISDGNAISKLEITQFECEVPNLFILPRIVSVVGLSDQYFSIAEMIVSKVLSALQIEQKISVF